MAEHGLCAVIGCGNLNRSDDGIGVLVARQVCQWLTATPREDVAVFDAGTGGLDVMFQARGATSLILLDACLSGSPPGSIFKLPGEEVAKRPEPGYSLHDFRWDHALYAGRKIFGAAFPDDVTVYLIEAAHVGLGFEISPAVQDAGDRVVVAIQTQISARGQGGLVGLGVEPTDGGVAMNTSAKSCIELRRGSLYVAADVYAQYFPGLDAVVLLKQEQRLLVLPVRHAAAGGLPLKIRNRQGDRVIHAPEFFRAHGIDDEQVWMIPVQWDCHCAALVAEWPH